MTTSKPDLAKRDTVRPPLAGLVIAATLLLGGCAVNPATGEEMFSLMSPAEEARIGSTEHPKLLKQFGGAYRDGELVRYVSSIGQKLVRISELPNQRFTFTVVDSPMLNAFALPGGYIYVTRGLLALANTEAELASVLAHEIGHVTARHAAQRYSQSLAAGIGLTVLGVLSGSRELARIAGQGAAIYLKSYSRAHELEADTLAIRYLKRAGYEPRAMVDFLHSMRAHAALDARLKGRDPAKQDAFNIMATHPRTVERVNQAIRATAGSSVKNPTHNRGVYLGRIDGMVHGSGPEQGYVRGQVFSHPVMGIRFQVPPGYRLINGPREVVAKGPRGALIIFDGVNKGRHLPPVRYLRSLRARGLGLSQIEAITINRLAAATGRRRINTSGGVRELRIVVIRFDARRMVRFLFLTPPHLNRRLETDLQRTTYSFRRLSAAEAAKLRPYRIHILRVRPGDTAAGLAARMPYARFGREQFDVLNALGPGTRLRTGEFVKVITE
ncbi:MAG: M48 family metalloprotease [Alphaproteobacteria bacterium]